MARKKAGYPKKVPDYVLLDHPLSGATVRYNGKVYDVEKVYRMWTFFRWPVTLMMHDQNRSSAMPTIGEWTRGKIVKVTVPYLQESAADFWATAEMKVDGKWVPLSELPFAL